MTVIETMPLISVKTGVVGADARELARIINGMHHPDAIPNDSESPRAVVNGHEHEGIVLGWPCRVLFDPPANIQYLVYKPAEEPGSYLPSGVCAVILEPYSGEIDMLLRSNS